MKNFYLLFLLLFYYAAFSQNITFTFSANQYCQHVILDSIKIENINRNCDTILYFPDTTLTIYLSTIYEPNNNNDFYLFPIYPNPYLNETFFKILVKTEDNFIIDIIDITGKVNLSSQFTLPKGEHTFKITGCNQQYYFLVIRSKRYLSQTSMLHSDFCNSNSLRLSIH